MHSNYIIAEVEFNEGEDIEELSEEQQQQDVCFEDT